MLHNEIWAVDPVPCLSVGPNHIARCAAFRAAIDVHDEVQSIVPLSRG